MPDTDRYTIISADTHAGGSHKEYREYLDPEWRDEFDAWREKYKNPWKDLRDTDLRIRNWDDDRRNEDQLKDGVVGEVLFPNTVPPFYPGFILFAGPPKEVVLVSPTGDAGALGGKLRTLFAPHVVRVVTTDADAPELEKLLPPLAGKRALQDGPTAYVCRQGACELPTSDPDVLGRQLGPTR